MRGRHAACRQVWSDRTVVLSLRAMRALGIIVQKEIEQTEQ
jgi:hypothetical protein